MNFINLVESVLIEEKKTKKKKKRKPSNNKVLVPYGYWGLPGYGDSDNDTSSESSE